MYFISDPVTFYLTWDMSTVYTFISTIIRFTTNLTHNIKGKG